MVNLVYHNIKIVKHERTNQLVVKGEVTNNSSISYSAVAVRIILFIRNITVANEVFTINGLPKGANKEFEKIIEGLEYSHIAKDITRYEMYTESVY